MQWPDDCVKQDTDCCHKVFIPIATLVRGREISIMTMGPENEIWSEFQSHPQICTKTLQKDMNPFSPPFASCWLNCESDWLVVSTGEDKIIGFMHSKKGIPGIEAWCGYSIQLIHHLMFWTPLCLRVLEIPRERVYTCATPKNTPQKYPFINTLFFERKHTDTESVLPKRYAYVYNPQLIKFFF